MFNLLFIFVFLFVWIAFEEIRALVMAIWFFIVAWWYS